MCNLHTYMYILYNVIIYRSWLYSRVEVVQPWVVAWLNSGRSWVTATPWQAALIVQPADKSQTVDWAVLQCCLSAHRVAQLWTLPNPERIHLKLGRNSTWLESHCVLAVNINQHTVEPNYYKTIYSVREKDRIDRQIDTHRC